ncbi:uncharacterized protein METZ01_LOCUS175768, partial [marine metagenome]
MDAGDRGARSLRTDKLCHCAGPLQSQTDLLSEIYGEVV